MFRISRQGKKCASGSIARAEKIVTVEKHNDGMPKDHAVFLRFAAHSILEKLRIVEAS
ncbi:hypothetical protein SAMN05216420_11172 [Nitrosospira sp. Nl5]|nr:hypothetical protein SAMN05216420_11172 [Nitrosospira sp. Nl5]